MHHRFEKSSESLVIYVRSFVLREINHPPDLNEIYTAAFFIYLIGRWGWGWNQDFTQIGGFPFHSKKNNQALSRTHCPSSISGAGLLGGGFGGGGSLVAFPLDPHGILFLAVSLAHK